MIYFIRESLSGHIKIGFATDVWARAAKIGSDCPGEVKILGVEDGGLEREAQLHQEFALYRLRGEWFQPGPGLVAYIDTLAPYSRGRREPNTWGESGLTDEALAEIVGVSRPTISRIRRGKCLPSLPVAVLIADAAGIAVSSLLLPQVAPHA